MKNLFYLLPLLVLLLSASQCNSTKAQQSDIPTDNSATEPTPAGTENTNSSDIETLLQPNEEGIPYPIYNSYPEIASLLAQADDKTYVINFWATWCQPCVAELPYFEQLATETADQEDIQIVMVSLDFQRDMRGKLKRFVENRPFTLPLIALADQDYNSWINLVEADWQGGIPATVIYNKNNRTFHERAFPSYAALKAAVEEVK